MGDNGSLNSPGHQHVNIDTDGDGRPDIHQSMVDMNHDGHADHLVQYIDIDHPGDSHHPSSVTHKHHSLLADKRGFNGFSRHDDITHQFDDANHNMIPDYLEVDMNGNGILDHLEVQDYNHNMIPDQYEMVDTDHNGIPDQYDVDLNHDGLPDHHIL